MMNFPLKHLLISNVILLLLSSYGSSLPSEGQTVNIYFSDMCFVKTDKIQPLLNCEAGSGRCSERITERVMTRQQLGGQVRELPPTQLEETLCPCSPVTGCVSVGV